MIPAAVSQTEMKMEMSWASLIEVDVFRMLRYCRMSGTVIRRSARRKRRPKSVKASTMHRDVGKRKRF